MYVLKDRSIYTVMNERDEAKELERRSHKRKASGQRNPDLAIAGSPSGIAEKKTLDPRLV